MDLLVSILCWFAGSCIAVSFIEYFIHRYLMHKRLLPACFTGGLPILKSLFLESQRLASRTILQGFNHEEDPAGRTISLRLDVWIGIVGSALVPGLVPPPAVGGPVFVNGHVSPPPSLEPEFTTKMHNPRPRWFGRTWFSVFRPLSLDAPQVSR